MNLNLRTFSQLVEDMAAALQSSATTLIDVSIGSVVRAVFEANASVVLWLQWLVLQVLQATRAATSSGPDLDSWMDDFGLERLAAIPSTGIVRFSRFAAGLPASIPTGTLIKTTDGSLSFSVIEDQMLSTWQESSSGYVMPSGVGSIEVPVLCKASGLIGNVLANTITMIAASLPGVDQVNNALPFANAADAEEDQAFRDRFQSFIVSRSRATPNAVRNAISGVRQGLKAAIEENVAPDGNICPGSFLVIIDDGTGYPSSDLIANVAAAVDSVRPIGTTFAVIAPHILVVGISVSVTLSQATPISVCISTIQNCISIYLDKLSVGKAISITRVAQTVYLASPGIENVTNILLNGLSSDIDPGPHTVIKAGPVTVTINGG